MVLQSTQLSSNKFAAFKFAEQPVGTTLHFYFAGTGTRPGKGSDFTILEIMAFDPAAKSDREVLESIKLYSISAGQAQIDSLINGKLNADRTQRVGRPLMFPGNFYSLTYKSPQGTKYKDAKGVERETTSIGFDACSLVLEQGDKEMFESFLQFENIDLALQAKEQAKNGQAAQTASAPSNLPEL